MKKIILLLSVIGLFSFAHAQRAAMQEPSQKLFDQGKEMFYEKNYTGASDLLTEYIKQATDVNQMEQAEYFMAASAFYRNSPNSGDILRKIGTKLFFGLTKQT